MQASLRKGRRRLDDKTVFVLDEAGMVSSHQMATFVMETSQCGDFAPCESRIATCVVASITPRIA